MADTDTSQATTDEATEQTAEEKALATAEATKAVDEPAKGADDASKDGKDERVVPDKYDLQLPDKSLLDPSKLVEISTFAKENGLTAEEAQAVVDRESKAASDYQDELLSDHEGRKEEWKDEAKADKEIGGDNLTASVELSRRVQERFGSEALGKMLDDTGFVHHPEWIRFTRRIGSIMSDDQFVKAGSKGEGEEQSYANLLYGKTTKGATG